jgi:hypothetical protein
MALVLTDVDRDDGNPGSGDGSTAYVSFGVVNANNALIETAVNNLLGQSGRDFALSDETSDLTTGTKITWYPLYAVTLVGVYTSVTVAPTDSPLIVDIHASGTTLMDTNKIQIETGEFHSSDATTQPTLTDTSLAQFEKVEIIVDQIGSTIAGAGLKCYILWTRTA